MRTAFFLRNVPVLAGLSDELLERLAGEVREVRVPAGSWIMREGDRAESMFIVSGGRIEVVHEGPPEILLRVLRRGDVLGELALLRDGVRAASARAQRDTELLELGRAEFEHLIEHAPEFALGLTRAMGAQIAASRSPVVAEEPRRHLEILAARHRRLDGRELTGETDVAADPRGVTHDILATHQQLTGRWPDKGGDGADKGRLARAVGTEDGQHLAGRSGELQPVQRCYFAESHGEAAGIKQRRIRG